MYIPVTSPRKNELIPLREKTKGVAPATIRTMHNALGIQEILFDIFNHVYANTAADGSTRKPNLNPSLAALARTCRAFQEPALDALWLQLDDLTPLLRCLPEDVWALYAVVEASQHRTEVFEIRRPLNESEWGILQGYTRRIRIVASINSHTGQLKETAIRALCHPPVVSPLFPGLRQIKWNDHRPETFPFIRQLAGPTVTNLALQDLATWGPTELSILGLLRDLCPNVKEVQILTPPNNSLSTNIVSELLCSWTDLRTVKCRSINDNAFLHLAALETLEVLSFTFERQSLVPNPKGIFIVQFPALRRLSITSPALPPLSQMMGQLHLSIEALDIVFGGWPTNQPIRSFIITLQQNCTHDALHTITLRHLNASNHVGANGQTHRLTLEDLFPLACFGNLVSLTLDTGCFVDLGDDDMLSLGASWPNIRHLSINEQRGWGERAERRRFTSGRYPGLTPGGLVRPLQKCKFLKDLCIAIDTMEFSANPLDCSSYGVVVDSTHINVLDSVIKADSVAAVATFFLDVYPFLETVTAWNTPAMSVIPGSAGCKRLWNSVPMVAAKIAMVRQWSLEARPEADDLHGPDILDTDDVSNSPGDPDQTLQWELP